MLRSRVLLRNLRQVQQKQGVLTRVLPLFSDGFGNGYTQGLHKRYFWDMSGGYKEFKSEEQYDDTKDNAESDLPVSEMGNFEKAKLYTAKYGWLVVGGTVGAYILSKSTLFFSSYLVNINFKNVAYTSFLAGFAVGGSTGGLVYALSRGFYIRPERVHGQAFAAVKHSEILREKMGVSLLSPLKAGVMRAYSISQPRIALDSDTRRVVWRPPRVQLIFQVYGGNNAQAVVSCAAEKRFSGGLTFSSISADVIMFDGKPVSTDVLLIEGDGKDSDSDGVPDVVEGDSLRDLVQLKKKYN